MVAKLKDWLKYLYEEKKNSKINTNVFRTIKQPIQLHFY